MSSLQAYKMIGSYGYCNANTPYSSLQYLEFVLSYRSLECLFPYCVTRGRYQPCVIDYSRTGPFTVCDHDLEIIRDASPSAQFDEVCPATNAKGYWALKILSIRIPKLHTYICMYLPECMKVRFRAWDRAQRLVDPSTERKNIDICKYEGPPAYTVCCFYL